MGSYLPSGVLFSPQIFLTHIVLYFVAKLRYFQLCLGGQNLIPSMQLCAKYGDHREASRHPLGVLVQSNWSRAWRFGVQTAEMPGFYQQGEYDVAGFAVGSVKKDQVIDGKQIKEGDVLLGLPSSGVHSNGFSLARRVLEVNLCRESHSREVQHEPAWQGISVG